MRISAAREIPVSPLTTKCRLKLVSYNLQVGINSSRYSDYVTQSWRHLLPDSEREHNLSKAANWMSKFDIVALQEVDVGSLRSDYVNQIEFLARQGGFKHFHHQQNRRIGKFAAHANGVLSKLASNYVLHHKLPGRIPGRGALQVNFDSQGIQIATLSVHLSLSQRARNEQLEYIASIIKEHPYFIIMGDMNCPAETVAEKFHEVGLFVHPVGGEQATYPRWKPKHCFDQIWISNSLKIIDTKVLDLGVSDHLPISMEIEIPEKIAEARPSIYFNKTDAYNSQLVHC